MKYKSKLPIYICMSCKQAFVIEEDSDKLLIECDYCFEEYRRRRRWL